MSLTAEQEKLLLSNLNSLKVGGKTYVGKIAGSVLNAQAATYSSGVVIGSFASIEVFTSPNGTGVIQSIVLGDSSNQKGALDLVFFDSATSATFSNGSAPAPVAADLTRVLGSISIAATDYVSFNANACAIKTGIGMVIKNNSTVAGDLAKIWVLAVSRDTKTYTNHCLTLNLGILQD